MTKFNRKDATSLLTAFAAIAFIPCVVLFARPRPIQAGSPAELATLARNVHREEVFEQMARRDAVSLNFSDATPNLSLDARWAELRNSMEQTGVKSQDAQIIAARAQLQLGQKWPCVVERGWIREQEVWFVIGSDSLSTQDVPWICPPKGRDIREATDNIYRERGRVVVVTINAQSHQVMR